MRSIVETQSHAIIGLVTTPETLPDDIAARSAALLAERDKRIAEAAPKIRAKRTGGNDATGDRGNDRAP
jgi:hypothetical protein